MSKAKAAIMAAIRGALSERTISGYKVQAPDLPKPTFVFTVAEAYALLKRARAEGISAYVTVGSSDMVLPKGFTLKDPLAQFGENLVELYKSGKNDTPRPGVKQWADPWPDFIRSKRLALKEARRKRNAAEAAKKAAFEAEQKVYQDRFIKMINHGLDENSILDILGPEPTN